MTRNDLYEALHAAAKAAKNADDYAQRAIAIAPSLSDDHLSRYYSATMGLPPAGALVWSTTNIATRNAVRRAREATR